MAASVTRTRMIMRSLGTLLGATILAGTLPLAAQPGEPPVGNVRSVGVWMGMSMDSPVGSRFGVTPDRKLVLVGLRAEWELAARGRVALGATADVLPLAIVTPNPTYRERPARDGNERGFSEITGEAPVYGAGLSPLGAKLSVAPSERLRIFGAGAAGFLWFTRNTPVPEARKFNFTFEYGGGLELSGLPVGTLVAGYRFHHLSNANTAPANPGLDGNVFYLGLQRRR